MSNVAGCLNAEGPQAYSEIPNENIVVEVRSSPGRTTVLGKLLWLGESGKC